MFCLRRTVCSTSISKLQFKLKSQSVRYCSRTTQYSSDVTSQYAQLKNDMHYFYDGIKSTVLSQLDAHNEKSGKANMKVIDIACGDGNYSRTIADKCNYIDQIIAVDISEAQIESAIEATDKNKYPNISYECLDAGKFHIMNNTIYKDQFDIGL
eukprot:431212_1